MQEEQVRLSLEEETKRRQEENTPREDVELQSQQPPSEFLQGDGWDSCALSRCLKRKVTEKLVPPPVLDWRLQSNTLKVLLLKKRIEVLEVCVTLDPDTAHPSLVLSEDLKRVRRGSSEQSLPDNPERFDVESCVLGRERFTSGRHCWEVEVEKLGGNEMWAVGVALESHTRKGVVYFYAPRGIWVVGKEPSWPHGVLAYTHFGPTPVDLTDEPRKIRVFLDYEERCVELFNADTDESIFSFSPASFRGEGVRPFFYVGENVSLQC